MPSSEEPPNQNEFLRLLAAHEAAIRTFLRSILPSLADADEAFQLTMITLWEKFDTYDASRDFKPWAFGIAKYKALSLIRDRQRERLVFGDELVERLAEEASASEARHLSQREALESCLQKLPFDQRELVLTAYTKGTRKDELARQLGQTPMTLYKKLQRIRQSLLECTQRTLSMEASS